MMSVTGSCHGRSTQFTVASPEAVTRCTCSFCSKRGALWAYLKNEEDFVLTTSRDGVSTYQWGSYLIEPSLPDLRLWHLVTHTPLAFANEAPHRWQV
jgi:hypothetical protein